MSSRDGYRPASPLYEEPRGESLRWTSANEATPVVFGELDGYRPHVSTPTWNVEELREAVVRGGKARPTRPGSDRRMPGSEEARAPRFERTSARDAGPGETGEICGGRASFGGVSARRQEA